MRMTIDSGVLLNIADAIRRVEGSDEKIKVTDYAERIKALEEIGGGSALPDNIYMGEFSPIVSTGEIHIEHNLGKIPYFVGVFAKGDLKIDKNWWESAVILSDSSIWATGVSTNGVSKKNTKGAVVTVTETDFDIDFSVSSYVYSLRFKITDYLIIVVC